MAKLKELEKSAGIEVDLATYILGNPNSLTFNENFNRACKLAVLSMRELERQEKEEPSATAPIG